MWHKKSPLKGSDMYPQYTGPCLVWWKSRSLFYNHQLPGPHRDIAHSWECKISQFDKIKFFLFSCPVLPSCIVIMYERCRRVISCSGLFLLFAIMKGASSMKKLATMQECICRWILFGIFTWLRGAFYDMSILQSGNDSRFYPKQPHRVLHWKTSVNVPVSRFQKRGHTDYQELFVRRRGPKGGLLLLFLQKDNFWFLKSHSQARLSRKSRAVSSETAPLPQQFSCNSPSFKVV